MKIKLLNDGGYRTKEGVKFPLMVYGSRKVGFKDVVVVTLQELVKVGFRDESQKALNFTYLSFLVGEECEIADE